MAQQIDFNEALDARPRDVREQAIARAKYRRLLIGDRSIGGLAVRAGIAIETAYLNSGTGLAWPSLATLADDIGCKRRAAISAIDELVKSGLILKRAGGGNAANTYTLPWHRLVHDGAPVHEQTPVSNGAPEGCTTMHGGGVERCTGVVSNGAPEPVERTGREEPVEGTGRGAPPKAPATKRARIPNDWQPSEADIAYAVAKGFAVEDVGGMADEFQNYWQGKGEPMADWSAAWRSNVAKKAGWKRNKPGGRSGSGVSGVAAVDDVFSRFEEGQR